MPASSRSARSPARPPAPPALPSTSRQSATTSTASSRRCWMTFGNPHRHYRSTDSTNTRARELAAAGAPHGTVITASEQTAGRGRKGRTWTAPPNKALLYSAIVRPLEDHHTLLPLAVPLAVCEAAEQLNPTLDRN